MALPQKCFCREPCVCCRAGALASRHQLLVSLFPVPNPGFEFWLGLFLYPPPSPAEPVRCFLLVQEEVLFPSREKVLNPIPVVCLFLR